MQHDPERLPYIEKHAIVMRPRQVKRFSPDSWSITEFNSQKDVDIAEKLYSDSPLLGADRDVEWKFPLLSVEFNMTHQSNMFKSKGEGCVLYEGKMINQFDHQFSEHKWVVPFSEAEEYL